MVREAEVAELLRTPMETKLRQLNALMASRNVFVDPHRQQEVERVRERWALLRAALGV
jgi:hypothetical protein